MKPPDFTGERYIPGEGGAQMAYEHLHRYLFALQWARGKRVLDLASGAGYGSALLAGVAKQVVALEIDLSALAYARSSSPRDNIHYVQGDAVHLPVSERSIDLVVAFEILEHLREPESMLAECGRILAAGGTALISTPNKAVYTDARDYRNPFHVKEFMPEEFRDLLGKHFSSSTLFFQQVRAGSLIRPEGKSVERGEISERSPAGSRTRASEPMYMIACCGALEPSGLSPSAYFDPTDALLAEYAKEIDRLNGEVKKLGAWGQDLERTVGLRDSTIAALTQREEELNRAIQQMSKSMALLQEDIAQRDETIRRLQDEFEQRSRWALELKETVEARDATIREAMDRIATLERAIEDLEHYLRSLRDLRAYRWLAKAGFLPP